MELDTCSWELGCSLDIANTPTTDQSILVMFLYVLLAEYETGTTELTVIVTPHAD